MKPCSGAARKEGRGQLKRSLGEGGFGWRECSQPSIQPERTKEGWGLVRKLKGGPAAMWTHRSQLTEPGERCWLAFSLDRDTDCSWAATPGDPAQPERVKNDWTLNRQHFERTTFHNSYFVNIKLLCFILVIIFELRRHPLEAVADCTMLYTVSVKPPASNRCNCYSLIYRKMSTPVIVSCEIIFNLYYSWNDELFHILQRKPNCPMWAFYGGETACHLHFKCSLLFQRCTFPFALWNSLLRMLELVSSSGQAHQRHMRGHHILVPPGPEDTRC